MEDAGLQLPLGGTVLYAQVLPSSATEILLTCPHHTIQTKLMARKKNEMVAFADEWTELESITLTEISQTQKVKDPMLSPLCKCQSKGRTKSRESDVIRTERRTVENETEMEGC